MADRKHPAVHRLEVTAFDSMADGPPAESEGGQLASRHDPVLTVRKLGDRRVRVTRRTFGPYDGPNCRCDRHAGRIARRV